MGQLSGGAQQRTSLSYIMVLKTGEQPMFIIFL